MAKLPKLHSPDEIQTLLTKLPREVRLDVLQFGLDLMGIIQPAADMANAGISLGAGIPSGLPSARSVSSPLVTS
jgi:hypothetical protein